MSSELTNPSSNETIQDTGDGSAGSGTQQLTVGLIADPDSPTDIASGLVDELPEVLAKGVSEEIDWNIDFVTRSLPLDAEGKLEAWDHTDELKSEYGWDMLVYVSELTRRLEGQLIVSDVNLTKGAALVSLPALGPLRLEHHTRNAIVRSLRELVDDDKQPDRKAAESKNPLRLKNDIQAPVRQRSVDDNTGANSFLAVQGLRGRIRVLLGMVKINRPWRLVPSLSGALAAGFAAAAFGIFFSSIWSMADSVSPGRMTSITIIAIAGLMAWLILYNDLWHRRKNYPDRKERWLYNGATFTTILIGVSCMYALLLAVTFAGALIVIPPDFLQSELMHSVNWFDYMQLALLSSSMGILAGALGSSFESNHAILAATYGKREQERHAKAEGKD